MNYKKELLRGLWVSLNPKPKPSGRKIQTVSCKAALPPESTEAGYIGVVM